MSRRTFLRLGLAGSALAVLGGTLAWHTSGYRVPRAVERLLKALTPKEYLVVEAVASRVLRSHETGLPDPARVGTALRIDELASRLDSANLGDLRKLLHLIEHVLPLRAARASRFTRLDGFTQDAVLRAMTTSSLGLLRGGFDALKSLCAMAYFADERTWRAIGYDGPLLGRPTRGWSA